MNILTEEIALYCMKRLSPERALELELSARKDLELSAKIELMMAICGNYDFGSLTDFNDRTEELDASQANSAGPLEISHEANVDVDCVLETQLANNMGSGTAPEVVSTPSAECPALGKFDIDSFLTIDVRTFTEALASLESRIPAGQIPQDDEFLNELTVALHRSREFCEAAEIAIGSNTELLKEMQSKFRDAIAPWFDQSWFMQRAKVKPRGYPGDYLMLSSIYDGKTKSTGIGGYLDLYFLNTDLARGVCTRLANVKQFILEEAATRSAEFSVLNVASGPGREYTHDFSAPEGMTLTCVDSDDVALEFLRENVSKENAKSLQLKAIKLNSLKMTSSQKNIELFGEVDMIYSVGLCDIIPDRFMIRILNGWRESVGENGIVYVAFKDFLKYYPAEYQWHVDWYFYQRTEGDCRKLFADAGYNVDKMEMFRDSSGVIMNFIAREPAIARNRFHADEGLRGPFIPPDADSELSEEIEATED